MALTPHFQAQANKSAATLNSRFTGPQLDVSVESENFMRTFSEYEKLCRRVPLQAVEKQARNLRIRLVIGFKKVKIRPGQADRELKRRGGRIRVRESIRNSYKDSDAFLTGKHGKGALLNRNSTASINHRMKSGRQGVKGETQSVPVWQVAVQREIAARNRSRAFLAASWLNPHEVSELPRIARLQSRVKSGLVTGEVDIKTAGESPEIILRNFIQAVARVGESRGIIAAALRLSSADMRVYIERKLAEAKQKEMQS
jgi:hypothetical protein